MLADSEVARVEAAIIRPNRMWVDAPVDEAECLAESKVDTTRYVATHRLGVGDDAYSDRALGHSIIDRCRGPMNRDSTRRRVPEGEPGEEHGECRRGQQDHRRALSPYRPPRGPRQTVVDPEEGGGGKAF